MAIPKTNNEGIIEKDSIAMVVLAAGASMRMGQPKQLLPWGDSNLMNDIISKGLECLNNVYIVLGANHETILDSIQSKKINIIINQRWVEGMGTSISEAVKKIERHKDKITAILFVLVDQPLLQVRHYKELIKRYLDSQHNIVGTKNHSHIGVPAIIGSPYFSLLKKLDGEVGAKHIISSNAGDAMVIDPIGDIVDLDTMATYKKLYLEHGQS